MLDNLGLQLKYFVLSPTKKGDYGWASREALRAYADAIRQVNPNLASDLIAWVTHIHTAEVKDVSDN